jgi:hemolysin III
MQRITTPGTVRRAGRGVLSDLAAPKEPFNSWSHLAAALVTLLMTPWLLTAVAPGRVLGMLTLVSGMVGTFLCSALTHAARDGGAEARLERWDRSFIYVLIAGTYTALSQAALPPAWAAAIIVAIWILAALGVALVWSKLEVPRWLSTGLYVLMGWTVLICIGKLWSALTATQLVLLLAGGLSYTIGAVIYVLRRPDPWPSRFGYHGIWHLMVVAGAGAFVALVVSAQ